MSQKHDADVTPARTMTIQADDARQIVILSIPSKRVSRIGSLLQLKCVARDAFAIAQALLAAACSAVKEGEVEDLLVRFVAEDRAQLLRAVLSDDAVDDALCASGPGDIALGTVEDMLRAALARAGVTAEELAAIPRSGP